MKELIRSCGIVQQRAQRSRYADFVMIRITGDLDVTAVVERRCRGELHVDVSIETCGEATMERTTCARHPRMMEFGAQLDRCSNRSGTV